ncbi:cation-transporting P-type ATPase [Coraliomargarita sinensis]|uniref:P-type Zn(2+) transporter n=1 Tax=Coraliomargarita sinensis TaxID=2174842 RepID=A0A317ZJ63_9BACT|nr:heavy metal translocating P-type ATPase [Coraliomargarita sinensis]PXA05022.1 cation-transporting P-type ATPase [Coraliomargarita sinensis]
MAEKDNKPPANAVVCRTGADCDDLDLKLSKSWLRIAVAGVFAGQGMVFSLALNMTPPNYGSTAYWLLHGLLIFSSLVVMGFLGGPLFASTWGMLRSRRLSIEGLFTLSLVGAFIGSLAGSLTGKGSVYYEIVSIVIAIYTFGRMLSLRSQAKLRAESSQLRERFDRAVLLDTESGPRELPVAEVKKGQVVRVNPGEPFTLDGRVRSGVGFVRETSLTGEPLPVVRRVGDPVRAGTFSEDGSFEVEVRAVAGERELDRILDTVESFFGRPSELQQQANRLVQYFLPIVVTVSLLTAVFWSFAGTWMDAVFNSMAVLLVACPCALGLATPVAIWNGLYRMARMGLVSRDGALIDGLAHARSIYFDKTGTLSESDMQIGEVLLVSEWESRRAELLAAVVAVESRVNHPVARALARLLPEDGKTTPTIKELRLIPGAGVEAEVELAGSKALIRIGEAGDRAEAHDKLDRKLLMQGGKRIYVTVDGLAVAVLVLAEQARKGLPSMWSQLEALGIQSVVLTGDPDPHLEIPDSVPVRAGLTSADKAEIIRRAVDSGEMPCLVGDGINDAAAMSIASSSISMGSGTGLTQSAAMGQLQDDRLECLPDAIRLARGIHTRLRGNLIYAAAYNILGMSLAVVGWLHPVAAALIMLVSSAFVTLRALRA